MSQVSYDRYDSYSSVASENDSIEDRLLCYLCNKSPTQAKLLDCLHYFCTKCISLEAVRSSPKETLTCPVRGCRRVTKIRENHIDNLPNVSFIELLNKTRSDASKAKRNKIQCGECSTEVAQKYCRDCCQYICGTCVSSHERMKTFAEHKVVSIDDVKNDIRANGPKMTVTPKCPKHGKEHELFCTKCNTPVCPTCMLSEHREHVTKAFKEIRASSCATLQSNLNQLKEVLPESLENADRKISKVKCEVKDEVSEAKKSVEEEFEESCKALEDKRDQLLSEIEEIAEKKTTSLDRQQVNISSLKSEMNRVANLLDILLEYGSSPEIATCHQAFVAQAQILIDQHGEQDMEPTAISDITVKSTLSTTLKKTQFLDEHINVSVPPADPTKCTAEGEGLSVANVGKPAEIFVNTFYKNEQRCTDTQDVRVEVNIDDQKLPVKQVSGSNGKYKFTYNPSKRGQYTIRILVCGKEITGSPFQVSVKQSITNLNGVVRKIKVSNPYQADFTPKGDLLVTESTTEGKVAIVPLHQDEAQYQDFRKPQTEFKLTHPTGLAAARDGFVYVAYSDQLCVVKYDRAGNIVTTTRKYPPPQAMQRIGRIRLDKDQSHLYVCDRGTNRVLVFETAGMKFLHAFATQHRCADVAFDENNHIHVADKSSGEFLEYASKDKKPIPFRNNELTEPRGIVFFDGFLCAVNRVHKRIDIFEKDKHTYKYLHSFGTDTGLADLGSITVDKSGYFYVCNERDSFVAVF